jgi:hypothetical protein
VGAAHILTGCLIILFANTRLWKKSILVAGVFGFFTTLPVFLWVYLHNYLLSGTLWGSSSVSEANVLENISQSLRKILFLFIPVKRIFDNGFLAAYIILGLGLVILVLINNWKDWQAWGRQLLAPALAPVLAWSLVYYLAAVLNIRSVDHKSLLSDRYFLILLVPILALLWMSFEHLVAPHISLRSGVIQTWVVGLFLIWLILPVRSAYKYVQESLTMGESGYNLYNTGAYRESETLRSVQDLLAREPGANLYSNIPPAVWFYTRHVMIFPPIESIALTKDQIKTSLAGWPQDRPGYYILFYDDPFGIALPLEHLSLVADMQVVEKRSDGEIVRVWSRGSK